MEGSHHPTINVLWIGRPNEAASTLPENYRITTTPFTSDFKRKVEELGPDLIILDLTNGAGERFRALVDIHRVLMAAPVIGLVDKGTEVLEEAIEAGLHDFLFAPIGAAELEPRMHLAARHLEVVRTYGHASGFITGCSTDLEFPTEFKLIAPLADILTRDLRTGNMASAEIVFQLRLTLSELLTNAMEHGSLGITLEEKIRALEEGNFDRLLAQRMEDEKLSSRRIKVKTIRSLDRIVFSIQDQGDGFDVAETMARLADPNPTMPCGRGLYLLQQFVDDFKFEDEGRKVTLEKRLSADPDQKD